MNLVAPLAALAMGLLGSTHCVLMCGGVVGALSAGMPVQLRTRAIRQAPLTIGYNLGRIAAYSLAGLLAGTLGGAFADAAPMRIGPAVLRVVAALFTLGVGLHLAGVFAAFARIERIGRVVWMRVQPIVQRLFPVRTFSRALLVGLLWGAMPCGLVYSALALSLSAGSAAEGTLTMLAFGLGTLPTLLAMSAMAGVLTSLARRPRVRHTAGFVIGAIGALSLVVALPAITAALHGSPHAHCH